MSKHHHPQEGDSAGEPPQATPQGRGFFYYVAVFFILIALLCFILNSASFNWSPTVPTPATSTTSP